jgi:hypothetical protein
MFRGFSIRSAIGIYRVNVTFEQSKYLFIAMTLCARCSYVLRLPFDRLGAL